MYIDDGKKIIIGIIAGILLIALIVAGFIFNNKRLYENKLKVIKINYESGEYERAMDMVDRLLTNNPEDSKALEWKKALKDARDNKSLTEKQKEQEKAEIERRDYLSTLNNLIEKSKDKPVVVRSQENQSNSSSITDSKESEKQNKINTLINEAIEDFNNGNLQKAKSKLLSALDIDDNNAEANAILAAVIFEEY